MNWAGWTGLEVQREGYEILWSRYTIRMYINEVNGCRMQVAKWGNSLAVRLPAALVEALELREGDDIEIIVNDARTFAVRKKPGHDALLKRLRTFRGKLPANFRFNRDEANER